MRATIYTAARGGPFFKKGCRRCGHAESKHHVEYVAYCDDCPEAVNEGYHEYEPQPSRQAEDRRKEQMSNGWNHLIAVNAEPRPQDQDEALINEVRTLSGYGPDVVSDVVILCMAGTPKERAEQIRRFFSPRVLPWG